MSEEEIKNLIGEHLQTKVQIQGHHGGGCINDGVSMATEDGKKIFVKINRKSEARNMFHGEFKSLEVINCMEIIKAPKPIKMVDIPSGGACLIMEHLDFHGLSKYSAKLGEQLARLHLLNAELKKKEQKKESYVGDVLEKTFYKYVDKCGFYINTCCGFLQQDNTWMESWMEFYARKIDQQIDMLNKNHGSKEARDLWSQLVPKLPKFFEGLEITPALLHGDLWGGNVGETATEPVIFDPASFYGHSEFDLAISKMFGGFNSSFFDSYHQLIPQEKGFRQRTDLYKLFHYLNHWNHFGGGYQESSLSTLKTVVKYAYSKT